MIDMFYPELQVEIGECIFTEGLDITISSSRGTYFDWAKLKFTKELQAAVNPPIRTKTRILMGYNSEMHEVFQGYMIGKNFKDAEEGEIVLKDEMILLEETIILNTFLDVTPQDILKYCLNKAGIANVKISSKTYGKIKRVPINAKTALEVMQQINVLWNIRVKFFFSEGTFYWGESPNQDYLYQFAYGVNIINLEKRNGLWELETVSVPFIRHSQVFIVSHPQIFGTYEIEKVSFATNQSGFIRTIIYFRG